MTRQIFHTGGGLYDKPRRVVNLKYVLIASLLWGLSAPALAITPEALVQQVRGAENTVAFRGLRAHELERQNLHLSAKVDVLVKDANNSWLKMTLPAEVAGSQMATEEGKARLYFPKEKLLFASDNSAGVHFASIFKGKLAGPPERIFQHYTGVLLDHQTVAGRNCYVLDFTPKEGFRTPGRRYYIDQATLQILGEDRSWAPNLPAYFTSHYETFSVGTQPIALNVAKDSRRVELKAGEKNYYRTFSSVAAASQALKLKIPTPTWTPPHFELIGVEVGEIFGSVIVNLHYNDGLNEMTVLVRPVSNLWVGLLAGAFSFDLINKFSTFSFLAPYNYQQNQMGDVWSIAYGDLWPEELERTVKSLR